MKETKFELASIRQPFLTGYELDDDTTQQHSGYGIIKEFTTLQTSVSNPTIDALITKINHSTELENYPEENIAIPVLLLFQFLVNAYSTSDNEVKNSLSAAGIEFKEMVVDMERGLENGLVVSILEDCDVFGTNFSRALTLHITLADVSIFLPLITVSDPQKNDYISARVRIEKDRNNHVDLIMADQRKNDSQENNGLNHNYLSNRFPRREILSVHSTKP